MSGIDEKRYPDERETVADPRQDFSQFGESLIAERVTQLHLESETGVLPLRDTVATIDNGSPSSATSGTAGGEIKLSSGTDAADSIKLETNQTGEYASSRQAQAALYFRRSQKPTQNQVIRWGYFDDDNGLFFEEDADGTSIVVRKGGTDRKLDTIDNQAIFDGPIDVADIPRDQGRIYTIDFAWYGAGKVVYAVEDEVDLDPNAAIEQSRIFRAYDGREDPALPDGTSGQYIDSPNLPIRVEIDNDPGDSVSPDSSLDCFIGGRQFSTVGDAEKNRRFQREIVTTEVGTTREPVFAIRPAETFKGRANGVNVRILGVSGLTDGSVTLDSEINGSVSDTFVTPPGYTTDETSVETVAGAGGTNLTESAAGIPTTPAFFIDSGQGSSKRGAAESERAQPLGIGQQFVVYAEAAASATSLDLVVEWSESF